MPAKFSLKALAKRCKASALSLSKATTDQKNEMLTALKGYLLAHEKEILQANAQDVAQAKEAGLSASMVDRLSLENRLSGIRNDIDQVIRLPDPVGEIFEQTVLPNALQVAKCRTPIGVLGVIYESRPNVTIDVSALAIKSGNCAILRGGSETRATNRILVELIQKALLSVGLPQDAIQLIPSQDRIHVKQLLRLHEYVDLIIPRGSNTLQQFCRDHSSIPVITGGIGICHLFVDTCADLQKSIHVILNAKTQRPTVCNALDTLLVHAAIAPHFLPILLQALREKGVGFRCDHQALQMIPQGWGATLAEPQDWDTEWLSLVLGVKVVKDIHEAIAHIRQHSSGHSDAILTENKENADLFIQSIDSAAVYVNASTRFTDGAQVGLGAEVAISTQKLHARGPMGLKELTTYKWVIKGNYLVRN